MRVGSSYIADGFGFPLLKKGKTSAGFKMRIAGCIDTYSASGAILPIVELFLS
jgi:hypothetical protein